MSFPIEAAINGGRLNEAIVTERVKDYLKRTQDRPAYRRALEKGPKYAYGRCSRSLYHAHAAYALSRPETLDSAIAAESGAPVCTALHLSNMYSLHSYQVPHATDLTHCNEEQEFYPSTPLSMRDCPCIARCCWRD